MSRPTVLSARPPRPLAAPLAALLLVLCGPQTLKAEPAATFEREVELLRRHVACDPNGSAVPPPPGVDPTALQVSCANVRARIDGFRARWLDVARPFLASVVPRALPPRVVYPFGGADLLHALAAFPEAELITTLSLEWVGDPRAIRTARGAPLATAIKKHHRFLEKLFRVNHSRTADLQALNASPIPAPLVFALAALELHGLEPTQTRFFTLKADGNLDYLTPAHIAAFDAGPRGGSQRARNQLFANVEVRFRRRGDPSAPTQTWRHLQANLYDRSLRRSPVRTHLESLGPFAAMTKAASYLLWRDDFAVLRDLLLDHMEWMLSDSTGISARHATQAGFTQEVWGRFEGNQFGRRHGRAPREAMQQWRAAPHRPLPIRFGYPDRKRNDHLLVTARPPRRG